MIDKLKTDKISLDIYIICSAQKHNDRPLRIVIAFDNACTLVNSYSSSNGLNGMTI
jgi:hypothetical protein